MKYIRLTQGKQTMVDDDMYDYLNQWYWQYTPLKHDGYAKRRAGGRKNRKTIIMHRVVINAPQGMDVDHINGDKLDNRRSNLRIATRSQNLANSFMFSTNTSGYKGVTWNKRISKWVPQLTVNGKKINLGYHKDLEQAAQIYNQAAIKYFGEYARINNFSKGGTNDSVSMVD